jgi:hypothetical protein
MGILPLRDPVVSHKNIRLYYFTIPKNLSLLRRRNT